MKLTDHNDEVIEGSVNMVICGRRLKKVELSQRDIIDLANLSNDQLEGWIKKLYVRIPPADLTNHQP